MRPQDRVPGATVPDSIHVHIVHPLSSCSLYAKPTETIKEKSKFYGARCKSVSYQAKEKSAEIDVYPRPIQADAPFRRTCSGQGPA
jgi:hypothetical protein